MYCDVGWYGVVVLQWMFEVLCKIIKEDKVGIWEHTDTLWVVAKLYIKTYFSVLDYFLFFSL